MVPVKMTSVHSSQINIKKQSERFWQGPHTPQTGDYVTGFDIFFQCGNSYRLSHLGTALVYEVAEVFVERTLWNPVS